MAQISLSKSEYEFESLIRMAHRMGHFFSIEVKSHGENWILEWEVTEELAEESIERIRNEVYEQIIREKVSAETKPIRDLIFAAAFSNIEIK
jgi:His-Xaa-Ser system protein HxsD